MVSNGDLPALMITDAILRHKEGVLGNSVSAKCDTFSEGKDDKERPQFTKPDEYLGEKIPDALKSGNPKKIEEFFNGKMK